jgi:hypothetical protein
MAKPTTPSPLERENDQLQDAVGAALNYLRAGKIAKASRRSRGSRARGMRTKMRTNMTKRTINAEQEEEHALATLHARTRTGHRPGHRARRLNGGDVVDGHRVSHHGIGGQWGKQ